MENQNYDSLEEAFEAMRAAERAANEYTTPEQRDIGMGDYWARPLGAKYDHAVVFGRVRDAVELYTEEVMGVTEFDGDSYAPAMSEAAKRLASLGLDGPDGLQAAIEGRKDMGQVIELLERYPVPGYEVEMWSATLHMTRDSYRRGYRFGKAFSVFEPGGEYGSTHVSQMVPISREEFERAREVGWDPSRVFLRAAP